MFLAHDTELYYDGPEASLRGLTEEAFYDKLAINFHHKYRDVVGDAAEVNATDDQGVKRLGNLSIVGNLNRCLHGPLN